MQFNEISFGLETVTIDDSHISMHNTTRSIDFINVAKTREGLEPFTTLAFNDGSESRQIIQSKLLMMYDVSEHHTRHVVKLLDTFSSLGGLISIFKVGGAIAYAYIGWPFRDLDFAIHAN